MGAGGDFLTLHIRRLRPEDFGDYSCKAQDGLGEAKAHTSLSKFSISGLLFTPSSHSVSPPSPKGDDTVLELCLQWEGIPQIEL